MWGNELLCRMLAYVISCMTVIRYLFSNGFFYLRQTYWEFGVHISIHSSLLMYQAVVCLLMPCCYFSQSLGQFQDTLSNSGGEMIFIFNCLFPCRGGKRYECDTFILAFCSDSLEAGCDPFVTHDKFAFLDWYYLSEKHLGIL